MLRWQQEQAELFVPEPQTGFTASFPLAQKNSEPVHWKEAIGAINEALVNARNNPEAASSLLALACYKQCASHSLAPVRAMFAKNNISPKFLSHCVVDKPFTRIG